MLILLTALEFIFGLVLVLSVLWLLVLDNITWLAFGVVVCAGGYYLWRHRTSGFVRAVRLPCLVMACAALPHLSFIWLFNRAMTDGIEPRLPGPLYWYESFAVLLHERVHLWLGTSFLLAILIGALAMAIALRLRGPRGNPPRAAYRKRAGRVMLAIVAASTFTLASSAPAGEWSPDLQTRLIAQLRQENEHQLDRALAIELGRAVAEDQRPLVEAISTLAPTAAAAARREVSQRFVSFEASSQIADAAAAGIAIELAVIMSREAELPPIEARESAAELPTLPAVRAAARRAASAQELRRQARDETKRRLAQTLAPLIDRALREAGLTFGDGMGQEMMSTLVDAFCDDAGSRLFERVPRSSLISSRLPILARRLTRQSGRLLAQMTRQLGFRREAALTIRAGVSAAARNASRIATQKAALLTARARRAQGARR